MKIFAKNQNFRKRNSLKIKGFVKNENFRKKSKLL